MVLPRKKSATDCACARGAAPIASTAKASTMRMLIMRLSVATLAFWPTSAVMQNARRCRGEPVCEPEREYPAVVSVAGQAGVEISFLAGHFLTQPFRPVEPGPGFGKFDLGDDQAAVGAFEHVDLETRLAGLDHMPPLLDQATGPQFHQCAGVLERDRIFELGARGACVTALDGEIGPCLADNANAQR